MRRATAAVFTALTAAACSTFGVTEEPVSPGAIDGGSDAVATPDAPSPAADASSGDGPIGPPPCMAAPDCERVAFVTSGTQMGENIDSLAKADAYCTAAAATSSLPRLHGRAFKAWLSDATTNAKDRLPHGTKPYVRVDGRAFAADFNALLSGSLVVPIDQDEQGNTVSPNDIVWTGTSTDGLGSGASCADWTSGGNGTAGIVSQTGKQWTDGGGHNCSAAGHLYCFEL